MNALAASGHHVSGPYVALAVGIGAWIIVIGWFVTGLIRHPRGARCLSPNRVPPRWPDVGDPPSNPDRDAVEKGIDP